MSLETDRIANLRPQVLEAALFAIGSLYLLGLGVRTLLSPSTASSIAVMISVGVLILLAGALLRSGRLSYELASHFFLVLMLATVAGIQIVGDGFNVHLTALTILIPMFAAFLMGFRGSVIYTVASLALLVGSYLIDGGDSISKSGRTPQEFQDSKVVVMFFVVLSSFAVASVYELNRQRTESYLAKLNADLEAAKQAAENSLAVKSRFLANVSHEVRTPLNGIMGMVTLMRDRIEEQDLRNKLDTIESAGESLLTMLNDVLDASKLDAGQMEVEKVPVNLAKQLHDVMEVVSHQAVAKGMGVRATLDSRLPKWIEGDPVRLNQLLFNLIGNAIKFSEGHDVSVEVVPAKLSDSEISVRVSVRDQGIGISAEAQQKLFAPFTQADSSTTRKFGGTGLGLSICKGIVEQMQGRIWVESEPGEGSTFSFEFPSRAIAQDMKPSRSVSEVSIGSETDDSKNLRILVAEDNDVNRTIVEAYLGRLGYSADYVMDGREAVDAVTESEYDLLLVDLQMPNLDGYATAREIVSRQGHARPHIIALTASSHEQVRDDCLSAGMDGYIAKPLRMAELRDTLNTVPARSDSSANQANQYFSVKSA